MAKYTIEESTLTSIADAIRTQYDDDSPINPLDMAEAILGIESGGSGGELPFGISYTTLSTTGSSLTFEHDLGEQPKMFAIVPVNVSAVANNINYCFCGTVYSTTTNLMAGYYATGATGALRAVSSSTGVTMEATDSTITVSITSTTYKMFGGIEYACLYW